MTESVSCAFLAWPCKAVQCSHIICAKLQHFRCPDRDEMVSFPAAWLDGPVSKLEHWEMFDRPANPSSVLPRGQPAVVGCRMQDALHDGHRTVYSQSYATTKKFHIYITP